MNIALPPLVDGDGGDRKTRSGSDDKDGNSSSGSNSNTGYFSGDEGQMDGGSNKQLKKKVKRHNPAEQINQGKV